jgi:hypothetical protein
MNNITTMALGASLPEALAELGWTPAQLAKAARVTRSTAQRWLDGDAMPSVILASLAGYLAGHRAHGLADSECVQAITATARKVPGVLVTRP